MGRSRWGNARGRSPGGRRGCRGVKRRGKETRKEEKMEETEG